MERTLHLEDLASAVEKSLISHGEEIGRAHVLGGQVAECLFKSFRGQRTYWAKGRKLLGLTWEQRRAIYLEWWTYRDESRAIQKWDISHSTLQGILAEGRSKRWEREGR